MFMMEVWLLNPATVSDPALLAAYHGLLSPSECERNCCLASKRLRHDHLLARALVRTVLGTLLKIHPAELDFTANPYGRPVLASQPGLSFNLSHTAGLIALAVSRDGEVGIDTEQLARQIDTLALAEYSFHSSEFDSLRQLSPPERAQRFLHYWTLKEAYLKALGCGLSLAMNHFAFDFSVAGGLSWRGPPASPEPSPPWFWLYQADAAHPLALCARGATLRPQIRFKQCIPLVSEYPVELSLLRHNTR